MNFYRIYYTHYFNNLWLKTLDLTLAKYHLFLDIRSFPLKWVRILKIKKFQNALLLYYGNKFYTYDNNHSRYIVLITNTWNGLNFYSCKFIQTD